MPGRFKKFGEMLLPNRRDRMCPVSTGLVRNRQQNVAPALYSFDFLLEDSKFRRVYLVIGGGYRNQGGIKLFNLGFWLLITECPKWEKISLYICLGVMGFIPPAGKLFSGSA